MNIRISALAIFAFLNFSRPVNAEEQWIAVASSDDVLWEGRAHTLSFGKNNSGEPIFKAMGRTRNLKSKKIEFQQWYVRQSDCQRGYGKLVVADMAGNFRYDHDFVLDGGSVASALADMLCASVVSAQQNGISS